MLFALMQASISSLSIELIVVQPAHHGLSVHWTESVSVSAVQSQEIVRPSLVARPATSAIVTPHFVAAAWLTQFQTGAFTCKNFRVSHAVICVSLPSCPTTIIAALVLLGHRMSR